MQTETNEEDRRQKMPDKNLSRQRLTIRVGRGTLAFALSADDSQEVAFEPFVVKSGISMAANLRRAFSDKSDDGQERQTSDLLMQAPPRVRVLIDSNVLMVPIEMFEEKEIEILHQHAFQRQEQDAIFYNVLPDLNAVAVFSMNKDLKLVVDDHFQDVRLITAMSPVWRHLHQRSFTGNHQKLYGYFHEKQLDIFCFQQNRFKYCNTFDASRPQDSVYYLLYVWNTLQMDAANDELHIVGQTAELDWMTEQLRRYLHNVFIINPAADFNRHPVTDIKGMPYDMQTFFIKGR